MLPVSRAAFPPPSAANDRQGPRGRQAAALPRRRGRGLLLNGLLLAAGLFLIRWASQGPLPRPPA